MRAFQLDAGPHYSLRLTDLPRPVPAFGEVLLRVRAAALNQLDLMVARGGFGDVRRGFVPGTDAAGEIVECGQGVRGWAVGDAVVPGFIADWVRGPIAPELVGRLRGVNMPGSLAEYVAVPADSLVRLPAGSTFAQGATLPIAATTAWNAIVAGGVRSGSTVLLLGTGGVSLFALQFAKAAGARVVLISSSDDKLERARALGADELINYRTSPDWDRVVLQRTGGAGADLVVETVGPATFARSVNAAAFAGTIYMVGLISGNDVSIPVLSLSMKTLRVIGSQTGSTADLAAAARAIAVNRIEPVIDAVYRFDDAAAAYRHLAAAGHMGKVVIEVA